MKSTDIIFLKKRKLSLNPRSWLSQMIALIQGDITHTAIVFERCGELFVRDMDWNGVKFIELNTYIEQNRERMTVKRSQCNCGNILQFNRACSSEVSYYDFFNLLFFQVVKNVFKFWIGSDTEDRRLCSEDTARCYNKYKYTFMSVESISPQNLFDMINKWEVIVIN